MLACLRVPSADESLLTITDPGEMRPAGVRFAIEEIGMKLGFLLLARC